MLAMSFVPGDPAAEVLKGDYLETRTCDVYTGPCFANGQVGLCGNDAMMANDGAMANDTTMSNDMTANDTASNAM